MLTALEWRYAPGLEARLIAALRTWFSGWPGIGRIVAGLTRQGLDLQLTRHGVADW
jgi:environmental stress-induced protein Ves